MNMSVASLPSLVGVCFVELADLSDAITHSDVAELGGGRSVTCRLNLVLGDVTQLRVAVAQALRLLQEHSQTARIEISY